MGDRGAQVVGELLVELTDPAVAGAVLAAVAALVEAGGVPFELIAGAPADRYGVRVTFRPAELSGAERLSVAAGLADHPWGPADWIGLRAGGGTQPHCKAYHRRPPPIGITTVHRGLPPGMQPVMAALDGDALEVYAIAPGEQSWSRFAESCVGAGAAGAISFAPVPLRCRGAHAVSVKHVGDEHTATTLYAFRQSLPADDVMTARWTADLDDADTAHYRHCLEVARRLGPPLGRVHGLAAWAFDRSGYVSRAVSLRVHPQHA